MARRSRRCGHCGEVIKDGAPTRFDTLDPEVIYHERCFWGICARRGWSFVQKLGSRPPADLIMRCNGCDELILPIRGRVDSVWYEKDVDIPGYLPYHPDCSPSKLDSE